MNYNFDSDVFFKILPFKTVKYFLCCFCKHIACTSGSTKDKSFKENLFLTNTSSRNINTSNVQKGHYIFCCCLRDRFVIKIK